MKNPALLLSTINSSGCLLKILSALKCPSHVSGTDSRLHTVAVCRANFNHWLIIAVDEPTKAGHSPSHSGLLPALCSLVKQIQSTLFLCLWDLRQSGGQTVWAANKTHFEREFRSVVNRQSFRSFPQLLTFVHLCCNNGRSIKPGRPFQNKSYY